MVLNVSMLRDKVFHSSAMFARKVDPSVYADVLPFWDRWMALKLLTQSTALGQPSIASNLVSADPTLSNNLPPPTIHEGDTLPADPTEFNGLLSSTLNAQLQDRVDKYYQHKADSMHAYYENAHYISKLAAFPLCMGAYLICAATCRGMACFHCKRSLRVHGIGLQGMHTAKWV